MQRGRDKARKGTSKDADGFKGSEIVSTTVWVLMKDRYHYCGEVVGVYATRAKAMEIVEHETHQPNRNYGALTDSESWDFGSWGYTLYRMEVIP